VQSKPLPYSHFTLSIYYDAREYQTFENINSGKQ
jgi:hypothetical protein